MLPLVEASLSRAASADGLVALVVVPTRELAMQVYHVAAALVRDLDVRVSFVCGGVERRAEDVTRLSEERPHILVASPGRLIHHLEHTPGFVRSLAHLDAVVLDEADLLLE